MFRKYDFNTLNFLTLVLLSWKYVLKTTMIEQKKIRTLSILILTIDTDGLYQNYYSTEDLHMLKI